MTSHQSWHSRPFAGVAAILAAAFLAGAGVAPSRPARQVADFTLANGLELVVIPDHRAPVVTHMIWYKVGAADETPGKSGLAHFLEHLMFKGTAKNPAGQFSQVVAALGGQENAFTSNDYTALLPARAERAAQVRDGIRGRPHDRPAAHRRGRCCPSATSSSRSRISASATIRARGWASRSTPRLFLNHPYGKPMIGWRHEMEAADTRRRHRLLPALLRAQRRRGGDRRRRRPGSRRASSPRRPTARSRATPISAARASAGAAAGRRCAR